MSKQKFLYICWQVDTKFGKFDVHEKVTTLKVDMKNVRTVLKNYNFSKLFYDIPSFKRTKPPAKGSG